MSLENIGGRQTYLGPFDEKQSKYGVTLSGSEKEVDVVYEFSYNSLPAFVEAGNEMLKGIPANAQIVSSKLFVLDAWVGGTQLDIGLVKKSDGTTIDADGLDAAVLTAALTAGAIIEGDGALIGASVGADAGVLEVAATGTYTAGSAKLILTYIPVNGDTAVG